LKAEYEDLILNSSQAGTKMPMAGRQEYDYLPRISNRTLDDTTLLVQWHVNTIS
jgi:hypothetical protein